jgi:hypothetical protein
MEQVTSDNVFPSIYYSFDHELFKKKLNQEKKGIIWFGILT